MTGESVISFDSRTWLIKDIKMYILNPKEVTKKIIKRCKNNVNRRDNKSIKEVKWYNR